MSIKLETKGKFKIVHEQIGDKISEVLSYVEYDPNKLFQEFSKIVNKSLEDNNLNVNEKNKLIKNFKLSIQGYTYFEN